MDGVDDFGVVDALEVDRGDPEVAVSELSLDDDERDAFVGHLDRVGVPELVRGKAAARTGSGSSPAQIGSRRGVGPVAPAGSSGDDAEQRTDGELEARV